jgi:endonuclease III
LLCVDDVEKVSDLRDWLMRTSARDRMLSLHGVGPKTFDYLCCLVGIDRIAVDRHVISFASEAGVSTGHYDDLQAVVSYAEIFSACRGETLTRGYGSFGPEKLPSRNCLRCFKIGSAEFPWKVWCLKCG